MDEDVLIRAAGRDDVPQIAELHVRAWQVAYRTLLPQGVLDGLAPAQRVPRCRVSAWRPGRSP